MQAPIVSHDLPFALSFDIGPEVHGRLDVGEQRCARLAPDAS